MEAIYKGSGEFECGIINAYDHQPGNTNLYMEGGDILIAREDILLIGNGMRTSTQGIDMLASRLGALAPEGRRHIIVQQLPHSPESFIHLDMVFTLLDRDKCMVFEPLILGDNQYQTVHITMENGKVVKINSVSNILSVLRRLGMDLEPIICGGEADEWDQEREQSVRTSSHSHPARSYPMPATRIPSTSWQSTVSRSFPHGISSTARHPWRATKDASSPSKARSCPVEAAEHAA